jgi:hypothetical protein
VHQYLLNDQRIFDAGDDSQGAATDTTRFDVDVDVEQWARTIWKQCMVAGGRKICPEQIFTPSPKG